MLTMANLLPPYTPKVWKLIGACVLGVIVLGFVLFVTDRCGGYFAGRKIDKLKANINAATNAVIKLEQQQAVLKERQERALEDANAAITEFNDAVNATEAARRDANAALEAVNQARSSNQVGVTVDELNRKLEALDR